MLSFLAAAAISILKSPAVNPWEEQIFYQIFPRSFRDSNGDGIGDFKGIEDGLDLIKKLGCTAILLNPIQKARVYHNYFADSWTDVDPAYGTLADFARLVKAAHGKNIKVVLDMEQQYVASGHPWYVAAAKNPSGQEASFLAKPFRPDPKAPSPWYNRAPVQLASVQLDNPKVVVELEKVFRFWSNLGVDGYRLDHMMDDLDWSGKSPELYKKLWTPLENDLKKRYPGTFFVGEQADWEAFRSSVEMFDKTPTDACFNFRLRNALLTFKKGQIAKNLEEYKYFTREGRLQLTFLENHDMNRFASEEPDPIKQRTAAALMCFAKGAPILYYGQEIGMRGEQGHFGSDGNDIPVRLAYRWGRKLSAAGTALWYKDTGPWWSPRFSRDDDGASLEENESDPHSLLNWYRFVIKVRHQSAALSKGTQEVVDLPMDDVLAFRRTAGTHSVLILCNLSPNAVTIPGNLSIAGTDLLSQEVIQSAAIVALQAWQVRAIEERR